MAVDMSKIYIYLIFSNKVAHFLLYIWNAKFSYHQSSTFLDALIETTTRQATHI